MRHKSSNAPTVGALGKARNSVNIGNIGNFRALRDSKGYPKEVLFGCNEAVEIINSWIPFMICSEVPYVEKLISHRNLAHRNSM